MILQSSYNKPSFFPAPITLFAIRMYVIHFKVCMEYNSPDISLTDSSTQKGHGDKHHA